MIFLTTIAIVLTIVIPAWFTGLDPIWQIVIWTIILGIGSGILQEVVQWIERQM